MAIPPPFDPREPPQPSPESIERHRNEAAQEAIQAICDAFSDGFEVLLHRDKLRDIYGEKALNDAFDRILDQRRRRR